MSRFLLPPIQGTTEIDTVQPLTNTGTPTAAILRLNTSYFGGYSTGTQTAGSTTVNYPVIVDTQYVANNITLANNTITYLQGGVYKQTFSVQLANPSTEVADVSVFAVVNGQPAPLSASTASVPVKHGQIDGKTVMEVSFIGVFDAGDTFSLAWHSTVAGVKIATIPATGLVPASPGVILLSDQILGD